MVARLTKPAAAAPAKPIRVMAGGHDVTDKMPRTAAELEKQRPKPAEAVKPAAAIPAAPIDDSLPHAGQPMPASIGLCADEYSVIRAQRLFMEKIVEQVAGREAEIREHIIANLSKSDDTGAAGKKYRAQIVMKDVPKLNDWTKLTDFIAETGRFDLIQKRLGEKAVLDMMEQGEDVPGVEKMKIPTVSITKI